MKQLFVIKAGDLSCASVRAPWGKRGAEEKKICGVNWQGKIDSIGTLRKLLETLTEREPNGTVAKCSNETQ